ncbi:MAG TPA: hypothetical protein VJT71_03770 [Pyrinomonadaceae bacterium]|nr:hypothetical protein [Pyrinomonadaceae bacterium]
MQESTLESGDAGRRSLCFRIGKFVELLLMTNFDSKCKRCDWGTLKPWDELDDEQKEVALRLPGSMDMPLDERKIRNRWCTRCWYEDRGDEVLDA